MHSSASQPQTTRWFVESGAQELESQFRVIVFHPSGSVLITDPEQEGKSGKLAVIPNQAMFQ